MFLGILHLGAWEQLNLSALGLATQPVRSFECLSLWEACHREPHCSHCQNLVLWLQDAVSNWVSAKDSLGLFSAPGKERPGELFSASTFLSVSWVTPGLLTLASLPSPGDRHLHFSRGCPAESCTCFVGGTIGIVWVHFPSRIPFRKVSFLIPRPPSGVCEVLLLLYSFPKGNL